MVSVLFKSSLNEKAGFWGPAGGLEVLSPLQACSLLPAGGRAGPTQQGTPGDPTPATSSLVQANAGSRWCGPKWGKHAECGGARSAPASALSTTVSFKSASPLQTNLQGSPPDTWRAGPPDGAAAQRAPARLRPRPSQAPPHLPARPRSRPSRFPPHRPLSKPRPSRSHASGLWLRSAPPPTGPTWCLGHPNDAQAEGGRAASAWRPGLRVGHKEQRLRTLVRGTLKDC